MQGLKVFMSSTCSTAVFSAASCQNQTRMVAVDVSELFRFIISIEDNKTIIKMKFVAQADLHAMHLLSKWSCNAEDAEESEDAKDI